VRFQDSATRLDATGGIVQVHRFGGDQGRGGTLAVTDRRVIIQTKRVGGYHVQDLAYGLLSGCLSSSGSGSDRHIAELDIGAVVQKPGLIVLNPCLGDSQGQRGEDGAVLRLRLPAGRSACRAR
jgi:hypothetical protein